MEDKYFIDLISEQQMRTNCFVNIDREDIATLKNYAQSEDMGEIEIIETILTLGYA